MYQIVSVAIAMPHMQGCMYSLKIASTSLVILSPMWQLNRGLKLKHQLIAYYKKISIILYRSEKDIYVDGFSVNNVNTFFRQHFDQLFQIHI